MNVPRAALPVVYVDESSNSGQNLLDPDQPVFTVAGVHLSDEWAASIVDEVCAQLTTQGEPKYSSLVRSSRGRKALMRALEQLPEGSTRSALVHKPFMVMAKLVDVLIEPLAHADGFNLYEDRLARNLAALLHHCGPVFGDASAYHQLQQAFVGWVRQRCSTDDLFVAVAVYRRSIPTQHRYFAEQVGVLESCRGVADATAASLAAGEQRDLLDPAVPSIHSLGVSFRESLGPFRLVHDTSKVIDRHATTLSTAYRYPDPTRPGYRLPPGAAQIAFADSRDHPQLQLADWAAGAIRQWAAHLVAGGGQKFAQDLERVVQPWQVEAIWPPEEVS